MTEFELRRSCDCVMHWYGLVELWDRIEGDSLSFHLAQPFLVGTLLMKNAPTRRVGILFFADYDICLVFQSSCRALLAPLQRHAKHHERSLKTRSLQSATAHTKSRSSMCFLVFLQSVAFIPTSIFLRHFCWKVEPCNDSCGRIRTSSNLSQLESTVAWLWCMHVPSCTTQSCIYDLDSCMACSIFLWSPWPVALFAFGAFSGTVLPWQYELQSQHEHMTEREEPSTDQRSLSGR